MQKFTVRLLALFAAVLVAHANDIKDATETWTDMRHVMVPVEGWIFAFVLLAAAFFAAKKRDLIDDTLLNICLGLVLALSFFVSLFFLTSPAWPTALLLIGSALLGFIVVISGQAHGYVLLTAVTAFNFLALLGKNMLTNDTTNILDALNIQACYQYYGWEKDFAKGDNQNQCTGYLSYLRFLAFSLIWLQLLIILISYLLIPAPTHSSNTGNGYYPSNTAQTYPSRGSYQGYQVISEEPAGSSKAKPPANDPIE